jgi:transcriptional regulator GlxA family with amidase domain
MKAAFVVFDRVTSLDFFGFYDPVTRLKSMNIVEDFEWRVCALTSQVVDDRELRIHADAVGEPLDAYDMLFVPGGFGTRELQRDAGFLGWLKTAGAPYCAAVVQERVVDEGDLITAGGVSASIDLGLHLVEKLAGAQARARIAAQMDYPYRMETLTGVTRT